MSQNNQVFIGADVQDESNELMEKRYRLNNWQALLFLCRYISYHKVQCAFAL